MVEHNSALATIDNPLPLLKDLANLSTLNHIYDAPDAFRNKSRHSVYIVNPQLTILMAIQRKTLLDTIPEEAWNMGFTGRLLLICAVETMEPFSIMSTSAQSNYGDLPNLLGELTWSSTAKAKVELWHRQGIGSEPTQPKLQNYVARRMLHLLKLTITSVVSRGESLTIEDADVERARHWLLEAEEASASLFN
jgi:hypothetical protein